MGNSAGLRYFTRNQADCLSHRRVLLWFISNQISMSLYENINKRKKAGSSRSKSKSTISKEAYKNMKAGFPKRKKCK